MGTTKSSHKKTKQVKPWKLISSTTALNEKWFTVRKDTIELPSGKIVDDYFLWESPDIATKVPFTTDNKFVICKQYRHAIGKVLYQFPAGAIDENETPEQAAIREIEEETGYVSSELIPLSRIGIYPPKLTGIHHLFLAMNATLGGVKQDDEMEESELILMSPSELWRMIEGDSIKVADSLTASLLALKKLNKW